MATMTDVEADALDELLTRTTPENQGRGRRFFYQTTEPVTRP
ncbi:MAG: hypothetical protein Pg6C_16210 [Treponemataceae bacterium]|nr:MAG: hypothetical protein Pg6C_16210 [Treponemataceae bacterium]